MLQARGYGGGSRDEYGASPINKKVTSFCVTLTHFASCVSVVICYFLVKKRKQLKITIFLNLILRFKDLINKGGKKILPRITCIALKKLINKNKN